MPISSFWTTRYQPVRLQVLSAVPFQLNLRDNQVDAHVGETLFRDAILPLVASGKTVILVTHAQHFLSHCDYIYTLHDGCISEHGTYDNLVSNDGPFSRLDEEFGGYDSHSERRELHQPLNAHTTEAIKPKLANRGAGTGKLEGRLIIKERRTTGSVSWKGPVLIRLINQIHS